jgi:hypothetical protein
LKVSDQAAGPLKGGSSFCSALLRQLGQMVWSLFDTTNLLKREFTTQHGYSIIGIALANSQPAVDHDTRRRALGAPGLFFFCFAASRRGLSRGIGINEVTSSP